MKTINKVILSPADRNCSGSQPCKQRDLEQRQLKMTGTFGFTLVELLVVVLIIGILSAIAIPMYQGAVDKSHWSTMLPGAKALKDAEEAVRMSNGLYTANMDNLDVRMPNGDVQYTLETVNDDGTANVVRAINSKLGDKVRLSNYLDENTFFGGQLHCEAKDNDERATRLCEKLLGGQELNTVGGYTRYLLDQSIDQATCGAAEKSWSTSKTKCYKDTAARCEALNMDVVSVSNDQCGWSTDRAMINQIVGEEAVCQSLGRGGCQGAIVQDGGLCQGECTAAVIKDGGVCQGHCTLVKVQQGGKCTDKQGAEGLNDPCLYTEVSEGGVIECTGATRYCGHSSTYDHGICLGDGDGGCWQGKFNNSSICYGNHPTSACTWATYNDTSCCCGNYCGNAPKCADFNIQCDPQYLK